MKDLMKKVGSKIHSFVLNVLKKAKTLSLENTVDIVIASIFGGWLMFLTVMNMLYFPYLVTWMCLVIPVLALAGATAWLFSKPSKQSLGMWTGTYAFAHVSILVTAIIYNALGIFMFYTIPLIALGVSIVSLYDDVHGTKVVLEAVPATN